MDGFWFLKRDFSYLWFNFNEVFLTLLRFGFLTLSFLRIDDNVYNFWLFRGVDLR